MKGASREDMPQSAPTDPAIQNTLEGDTVPLAAKPSHARYTPVEDELMVKLRKKRLPWDKIIEFFPGRTKQGLQQRYSNLRTGKTNSDPQRISYTPEEDRLLKRLVEQRNLSWKQIAAYFPGRSSGALQNHYWTKLKTKDTP